MSSMYEPRSKSAKAGLEGPNLAMPQRPTHTSSGDAPLLAPSPPWLSSTPGATYDALAGARRLSGLSSLVLFFAVLFALAGVVGGGFLCAQTEDTDCGSFGCLGSTHPYVSTGITLIVASIVQALIVALVAQIGKVVAENRWTLIGVDAK